MTLDYSNVKAFNKKRCPYFVGVKENGNIVSFELPIEEWEKIGNKLNKFFDTSYRLNVYENEEINISHIWRNERLEEWEEDIVYTFKENLKEEIKKSINFMLVLSPIARTCDNLKVSTYNELIKFAKKGNF